MVPGLPTHLGSVSSLAAPLRAPRYRTLLPPVAPTQMTAVINHLAAAIRAILHQIQTRIAPPHLTAVVNQLVAPAVRKLLQLATATLPVRQVVGTV